MLISCKLFINALIKLNTHAMRVKGSPAAWNGYAKFLFKCFAIKQIFIDVLG